MAETVKLNEINQQQGAMALYLTTKKRKLHINKTRILRPHGNQISVALFLSTINMQHWLMSRLAAQFTLQSKNSGFVKINLNKRCKYNSSVLNSSI